MTRLLSIITPVFNGQSTLERTLTSFGCIAADHRKLVEIILVDDGSTDKSFEIMRHFSEAATSLQITLIQKDNGGSASARNMGLSRAVSRWVMFLDSDDELACDPVPLLYEAGDATAVICSVAFKKNGRDHGTRRPRRVTITNHLRELTSRNPNYISAYLVDRNTITASFDESLRTLEDWCFWMENPRAFERVQLRPHTILSVIHVHQSNKSRRYSWRGEVRSRIARIMLDRLADSLTRLTRNNLRTQDDIGQLQRGQSIPWHHMLRFPCSLLLYWKLWVYFVLRTRFGSFDFYGRRGPTEMRPPQAS